MMMIIEIVIFFIVNENNSIFSSFAKTRKIFRKKIIVYFYITSIYAK